jgi:hypothetical protein
MPKERIKILSMEWCQFSVTNFIHYLDLFTSLFSDIEVLDFNKASGCQKQTSSQYRSSSALKKLSKFKALRKIDLRGSDIGRWLNGLGKRDRNRIINDFMADHPMVTEFLC